MNYSAGDSLTFKFTTRNASLTPTLLTGSPTIAVYKAGSTTESSTGVTLTPNYDSRTGLNNIVIDTTADDTFYANGFDYDVVLTGGTVDSVSVNGLVVGHFRLEASTVGGPVEQTPVADEFTILVPKRSSTNLAATPSRYIQTTEKIRFAVDFVNVLHEGDAVNEILSITEDQSLSLTITPIGVCGTQAKMWIEDALVGLTYRIECKVTTMFGLTLEGDFILSTAD